MLVKTPRTVEERDKAVWDGRNARTADEEWALQLMRRATGQGRELAVAGLVEMVEQGRLAPHTSTQPFWRSRGILDFDIAAAGFRRLTEDFWGFYVADVEAASG